MRKMMMNNFIIFLLSAVFVLSVLGVSAQDLDGNPENWCRNGHFPLESNFKTATVIGKRNAKVYFLNDFEDCPRAGNRNCITKSYVVPGDRLIVTRKYGEWICAWYELLKGDETVGWIRAESLVVKEPENAPAPAEWIGRWTDTDSFLKIKKDKRRAFLNVNGEAIWRGLGDNIHYGGITARAKPAGNELILLEEDCRVRLTLAGDLLIASDNFQCGGANVRFVGIYQKEKNKARR